MFIPEVGSVGYPNWSAYVTTRKCRHVSVMSAIGGQSGRQMLNVSSSHFDPQQPYRHSRTGYMECPRACKLQCARSSFCGAGPAPAATIACDIILRFSQTVLCTISGL